jgi:hypothetical protein
VKGLAATKPPRVQTPQLITQVLERGERGAGFLQNDNIAWRSKLEGKPTDYVFPTEGVPTEIGACGLLKASTRPHAAALFYEWWMGESTYQDYDLRITDAAEVWLQDRAAEKRGMPWVLFVSLVCPHFPLIARGAGPASLLSHRVRQPHILRLMSSLSGIWQALMRFRSRVGRTTHHNPDNKVEFAMRVTLHLLAAAALVAVLAT